MTKSCINVYSVLWEQACFNKGSNGTNIKVSNEFIEKQLKVAPRTVTSALTKLKEQGYISYPKEEVSKDSEGKFSTDRVIKIIVKPWS